MKSKPPNKKARLDTMLPTTSPGDKMTKAIPSGKASLAVTASELYKMKAGGAASTVSTNQSLLHLPSPSTSGMPAAVLTGVPFQNIIIPDFNKDYAKMSALSAMSSSSGSSETMMNQQMPIEDLDTIQTELETLLCSLALRVITYDKSREILKKMPATATLSTKSLGEHYDPNHQEKINAIKTIMDSGHGTRTSVSAAAKLVMGTQLAIKTHAVPNNVPSASSSLNSSPILLTGSSRKSNNSASAATIGLIKLDKQPKKKIKIDVGGKRNEKNVRGVQNRSHSILTDDSSSPEAPNQFWEFTETYCHNITTEDIEQLDKLIESHKPLPEGTFNIPPLGKYYRDIQGSDLNNRLKNHESQKLNSKDICGPLTQRLVSALVEESVNHYNTHNNAGTTNGTTNSKDESDESVFINRPGLAKALGFDSGGGTMVLASGPPLEARLRQVLLEQGLLQADDDPLLETPDDEIMAEIKRTQNTLTKIHQYNLEKLNELHDMAMREQSRVLVKNELDKADKEVIEAYRLVTSCRQKKKPLTKKEKDGAARALQSRNEALDKLFIVNAQSET